MKKILIPVDGSDFSDRAILKGKELALACGSQIILLNVMNLVPIISYYSNISMAQQDAIVSWPVLLAEAKENSKKLLDEAKQSLIEIADRVETVVIEEPTGQVAKVISEFASENGVDMIIMGSNGMGSLKQRIYMGSVTTRVLHTVKIPVLVIQ